MRNFNLKYFKTMNQEEQIIFWNDRILLHLLELRESKYPNLTFRLRNRNNNNRLNMGYWFRGSYYISVGFVQHDDPLSRLCEVGFVVNFENENPRIYLQLSLRSLNDNIKEACYKKIVQKIEGLELRGNYYYKHYNNNDIIKQIDKFLENDWNVFLSVFKQHNLLESQLVDNNEFNQSLARVLAIRKTFFKQNQI